MKNYVTYPKELRELEKNRPNERLITIQTLGITFQGTVPKETATALCAWMTKNILQKEEET